MTSPEHLRSDIMISQVDVLGSLVIDWVLTPFDAPRVVFIDHDRSMAFHLLLCSDIFAIPDP